MDRINKKNLILANMSNGFAFPHDEICYFQSQHGHSAKCGYFRIDAMPIKAIIHLLKGGTITIIDATRKDKLLSDALKFGVPTWCLVFNRAIGMFDKKIRYLPVCGWQTPEMLKIAHSKKHEPEIQKIRKLAKIFGWKMPAIITHIENYLPNVFLVCYQNFVEDDKPKKLAGRINGYLL